MKCFQREVSNLLNEKRIKEIDRIVSSNEFWALGSGEHMNMIDDCLDYINLLEQRINHLAWSNVKHRQQREKYKNELLLVKGEAKSN